MVSLPSKNVAISDARSRSATYHYVVLCCATLQSRCVKTSGTPDTTTLIYQADKVKYAVGGRECIMMRCTCRGPWKDKVRTVISLTLEVTNQSSHQLFSSPFPPPPSAHSLICLSVHHFNLHLLRNIKSKGGKWVWQKRRKGHCCLYRTDRSSIIDVPPWRKHDIWWTSRWVPSCGLGVRKEMRGRLRRVLRVEECWQGISRHAPSWLMGHGPPTAGKHHDCLNQDKPRVQFIHLNTSVRQRTSL